MTNIEELHFIVELIHKHDLPLSPILEYAIREREEQYKGETNENCIVQDSSRVSNESKELKDYCNAFANLSVSVVNGKKLPHKAIMLLTIINLIEKGEISYNRIEPDNTFAHSFAQTWKEYYGDVRIPSVWTPFWYMKSEPFWHFKANGDENQLKTVLSFAGHPTTNQMRHVIKYAYFDKALFQYIKDEECRRKLKGILLSTYF